ncbi:MAG: hypothetical protein JWN78_2536 [Bacteroidota bacterium]|nr:hypothetical protein [Bacteroidota bacterium]
MKTFLTSLFILAGIYIFAETGPTEEFNSNARGAYKVDFKNLKRTLPEKENQLFAINNSPAVYVPVKPTVSESPKQETVSAQKITGKERIRIYPNAKEGELWVETDMATKGLDMEIFNSTGQGVYKTKLAESFHKVDLCNFENGKYLIKVGAQTYQLMVIQ